MASPRGIGPARNPEFIIGFDFQGCVKLAA